MKPNPTTDTKSQICSLVLHRPLLGMKVSVTAASMSKLQSSPVNWPLHTHKPRGGISKIGHDVQDHNITCICICCISLITRKHTMLVSLVNITITRTNYVQDNNKHEHVNRYVHVCSHFFFLCILYFYCSIYIICLHIPNTA